MRLAAGRSLLGLLLAAPAQAQPAATSVVALEYQAPSECPSVASFRSEVLGRTGRVRFAEPGDTSDLVWSVSISQNANTARGTLRVQSPELGKLERKVTAASCEQVVVALAFGAGLSVDPEASLKARSEPPAAPAPTPPPAEAKPPAPSPSAPKRRTRLAVGLTLTVRSGVAPQLAWAPRPFLGLSFRSSGGYTWGLGVSATQVRGSARSDVGTADFTWSAGRFEVFPVRFGSERLRLEPALFLEAGQLQARGVAVTPSAEVERPLLLVGGLARLSLLAFDLLLLQVEAGPAFPVLRDRFYLQENTTVFQVPAVAGFAAAGVGLEFL